MFCKCSSKYFICKWNIHCLLFFFSSYTKPYSLSILFQVWHLPVYILLPLVLHPWVGLHLISDLPEDKVQIVSRSINWKTRVCLVLLYSLYGYLPVNCILWWGAVLFWGSSHIQVNVVPNFCSRPVSLLSNSILNAIHL
jgi:hypothetical protein